MDSLIPRRPRHATVVAYLALFVALGGSSYAALRVSSGQIADNGVRSKDIRNNDVRGRDIRRGTLGSSDVADGSLRAEDFKAGELPAGPRGATGAPGEAGAQGTPGVSGLQKVFGQSANNSNSFKFASATCPAGKRAIGSGGQVGGVTGTFPNELADVVITFIEPSDENTVPGSVTVFALEEEPTMANWFVQASAICANVS